MAIDAQDGSKWRCKPEAVYLATERLKELFAGVHKVFLVDDTYLCLRGEDTRELLEACGATRYLQSLPVAVELSLEQRSEIRRSAGLERSTWQRINDSTLRGLSDLLKVLPLLDTESRSQRAQLLWEALSDLENRRGSRSFLGEYTWGYGQISKIAYFDAAFVRQLNTTAWVPTPSGNLERPEFVVFDTLGWKSSPFLQSKILFKPKVIETLAREAGIEPAVLDLLKKYGLTSEAELRDRLGLTNGLPEPSEPSVNVEQTVDGSGGWVPAPNASDAHSDDGTTSGLMQEAPVGGDGHGSSGLHHGEGAAQNVEYTHGRRSTAGVGRTFVSYVAVQVDELESDPDGLDHSARMALESRAIDLILLREPEWGRTPAQNPGYDLHVVDGNGNSMRWCEVKAMTQTMETRPVALSRTQFRCAQEHGDRYWLYVVEQAATETARIIRIQNPAGKARAFTFDHGWIAIAAVDDDAVTSEV